MPRTFIVLEKDDDLRSLYRRKLEQKFPCCVVMEALSCARALEGLDRLSVDAIIVNQAALDARGLEMVQAVRQFDANVPLVSICDAAQAGASLRSGADSFIDTSRWEDLGTAVEQVLVKRGQH